MVTTNTLVVAAEAFPLAKTGGLADAIAGMTRALAQAGQPLSILLPAYRGVRKQLRGASEVARLPGLPGGDAVLVSGTCPESGLDFILLENAALYDRAGLYVDEDGQGYADNAVRFAALAHAALRIAQGVPGLARPDVVHAHDWHAALTPLLLHAAGVGETVKSVLTIHNLAFQGQFPVAQAAECGIDARYCNEDGAVAWGQLNFLKAGIRYASRVTTVSRNYAREILTPAFGCGLDGLLRSRANALVAIPNGIDDRLWDPANDIHLGGLRYTDRDLSDKIRSKAALQADLGLRVDGGATLLALGSRLTEQKMADVAANALPHALRAHPTLQIALLGKGERKFEKALLKMKDEFKDRCAVHIGYDEAQAHRLHAGSDILLHGSRFEPFGLTPLYAMRYGTLPIGSRVGGMLDTIKDPGESAPLAAMHDATGLLFEGDTPQAMCAAIARAMGLRSYPTLWRAMQRNAMKADFSWRTAVAQYRQLFDTLANRPDRWSYASAAKRGAALTARGGKTPTAPLL
jgi:starch synthase